VLAELAGLQRDDHGPRRRKTPAALIDHILTRYHAVHREQLPELIRMARRVEAVHRESTRPCPTGWRTTSKTWKSSCWSTWRKEEQVLFPAIEAGSAGLAHHPIGGRCATNTPATAHSWNAWLALTTDHTPPAGACNTWRALYAGTAQLTDDLISHIHLENNVLFPQVEGCKAAPCN
jgi:regulator of cell morphogenesis and NO signaling